jgi:hypothetical protein
MPIKPPLTNSGHPTFQELLYLYFFLLISAVVIPLITLKCSANAKTVKSVWFSLLVLVLGMIASIALFTKIYLLYGFPENFETALYFSLVTWTTLGYGDLVPIEATRLYAASEAMLGYLYLGIFVSVLYKALSFKAKT